MSKTSTKKKSVFFAATSKQDKRWINPLDYLRQQDKMISHQQETPAIRDYRQQFIKLVIVA